MPGTIAVHGSDGEVMAPFGRPGVFYRGKHVMIRITSMPKDEDLPIEVRQAMMGLEFDTVFTREQIIEQCGEKFAKLIPEGSRLAYAETVIKVLKSAGKKQEADSLYEIASNPLDMLHFQEPCFQLI